MSDTLLLQRGIRFKELRLRHPELGVVEMSHDVVRNLEFTGIVAAADRIRNAACLLQIGDLRNVVQIDDRAGAARRLIFLHRGLVGAEHDPAAGHTGALAQD